MSLLNDVLKDLDKSKRTATVGPVLASGSKFKFLQSIPHISPWVLAPFMNGALFLLFIYLYDVNSVRPEVSTASQSMISMQQSQKSPPVEAREVTFMPASTAQTEVVEPVFISAVPEIASHFLDTDSLPRRVASDDEAQINKVFAPLTDTEWHDEQLNLALIAIQENQDENAEQILTRILARFPRAIVARETLANLYLAQERMDSARQIIDEGLQFLPHAITLNTLKARLLFEEKHPKEALAILKQFSPGVQKNPDFYGLMAAILQSLGQRLEAEALYKVLVKVEPGNSHYWLGYGIALEHERNIKQAITAYKAVTGHYDADPDVRIYAENRLKTLQG